MCSKIKVWDLQAALDPRAPASTLCLRTLVVSTWVNAWTLHVSFLSQMIHCLLFACQVLILLPVFVLCVCVCVCLCVRTWGSVHVCALQEHSGRVFRLQFDEFQIISSSHDDTILIWDFLNVSTNGQSEGRSPSRTYTYISR